MIRTAPEGFVVPAFEDIDLAAHLARLPANATVKGTIADSVLASFRDANLPLPTKTKYMPFRDYPMHEILEMQASAARQIFPNLTLGESLHRLGKTVFPTFSQTLIGRVMYGVFGNNVASIFKLANKSFELTQNVGKVTTTVLGPDTVRLSFTNTYTFLSSFHFGILEGTLEALRVSGHVWFRERGPHDGDFHIMWDRAQRQTESQASR